jgi:hypothetical protein
MWLVRINGPFGDKKSPGSCPQKSSEAGPGIGSVQCGRVVTSSGLRSTFLRPGAKVGAGLMRIDGPERVASAKRD